MFSLRAQGITGLALFLLGIVTLTGWPALLAPFTYPIAWWGLLAVADTWNTKRYGRSLWRGSPRHFLLILIPASVLYWLLFEVLNLAAPQWRYRGGDLSLPSQVLFGFVSFSTVIPAVVEAWWLLGDRICIPQPLLRFARKGRLLLVAVALLLLAIPLWNSVFWFNQGMWIAPALLLLPFLGTDGCPDTLRFLRAAVAAGLLAGLSWESLNFWAATRWEYLILPDAPHLFAMPLPGFIGFIPFAVATVIVYQALLGLRAGWKTGASLYLAALLVLAILTALYVDRGLWIPRSGSRPGRSGLEAVNKAPLPALPLRYTAPEAHI